MRNALITCIGSLGSSQYTRNGVITPVSRLVRLTSSGALDTTFFPPDQGLGGLVKTLVWDSATRKLYAGGQFQGYWDGTTTTVINTFLTRITEAGAIDTSFVPAGKGASYYVQSMALDPTGSYLYIGGNFTNYVAPSGTTAQNSIARLSTATGEVDTTFLPAGKGFNNSVYGISLDATNSWLYVIGDFTSFTNAATTAQGRLTRLSLTNATPDTTFVATTSSFDYQYSLSRWGNAVLYDPSAQKIHAGGVFDTWVTASGNNFTGPYARFNTSGAIDPAGTSSLKNGFNAAAFVAASDSSGRIYVGGEFTSFVSNGTVTVQYGLARFNADGSLDTSYVLPGDGFKQGAGAGKIYGIAVDDAGGKVYVAGQFNSFVRSGAPTTINNLVRLNTDGSLDTAFVPATKGASSAVYSLAWDAANSRLYACGGFATMDTGSGPVTQNGLTRIAGNGAIDTTFVPSGGGLASGCLVLLHDPVGGWLYAGGGFTAYTNGSAVTQKALTRISTTTGLADTSFVPSGGGFTAGYFGFTSVRSLALNRADNRLYVGGDFGTYTNGSGTSVRNLASLMTTDGTVDTSLFASGAAASSGGGWVQYSPGLRRLLVSTSQAQTTGAGVSLSSALAAIKPDGTADATVAFPPVYQGSSNGIRYLEDTANSRIYAVGAFNSSIGSFFAGFQSDGSVVP